MEVQALITDTVQSKASTIFSARYAIGSGTPRRPAGSILETSPLLSKLEPCKENLLSDFQAALYILNVFVGNSMLSMPFACAKGGFASIIGLFLACIMMCYTGKL